MRSINVFSPKFRTEEVLEEIRECLECGWTGLGYKTVEFEKAWESYTGLQNSHFLASNTVGLHLAIHILKITEEWHENDEIITTPLTFVSTNHSILYENLRPVFADVDEYLCMDPSSLEARISDRTRAVMYVGVGGNTGRLEEVSKICRQNDLRLILDAAHMAGTYVNSEHINHVGKEADISVFSFQAVKNLPTGDSGIICFKKSEQLSLAKKLTWLGIDKDTYSRTTSAGNYKWKYDVPFLGFKYHGNSVMASMALVQLKYLDEENDRRNEIAEIYNKFLGGVEGIDTIEKASYCHKSSRHLYQILVKNGKRDDLIQHFYDNNIYPGVHYTDNTVYPMYKSARGTCPNAHKSSDELLTLPIHLNLKDSHIVRIVDTLTEGLEK